MFSQELLSLFPTKRIKAADGMAVTAQVWEEAHDQHRQLLRFHTLLNHGAGIVTGLEVIASDPADSSVYILPGIAVDALGQTIVLPEPRAYDLGMAEGMLYLILTYAESRPRYEGNRMSEDAPLYINGEYGLQAVGALPATAHVELARVRRQGVNMPITLAKEPAYPRPNELDLRFRQHVGARQASPVSVALSFAGSSSETPHAAGLSNLAQSLRQAGHNVWVDRNVPLRYGLESYALVCLVGRDAFDLGPDEMTALYNFRQRGGVIFYESCRRYVRSEAPGGDRSFRELMGSLGIKLEPLPVAHRLLAEPYLFGEPPDGFETLGQPQLEVADGVIFSTYDYGCLWQGARRDRIASRNEIRNALEFGANIVQYAISRALERSNVGPFNVQRANVPTF